MIKECQHDTDKPKPLYRKSFPDVVLFLTQNFENQSTLRIKVLKY